MDKDALYEIFRKAMYDEYAAHEFYLKAAADTSNKEAKELFTRFAAIELGHRMELEKLYRTLRP